VSGHCGAGFAPVAVQTASVHVPPAWGIPPLKQGGHSVGPPGAVRSSPEGEGQRHVPPGTGMVPSLHRLQKGGDAFGGLPSGQFGAGGQDPPTLGTIVGSAMQAGQFPGVAIKSIPGFDPPAGSGQTQSSPGRRGVVSGQVQ